MKQLTQNMKSGELKVEDVPPPSLKTGGVLVKNYYSLISAGTEKSKVELGKKSMLQKVRSRPEDVKRVLSEVRQQGILATYKKVMSKLEAPSAMGYSSAGVVISVDPFVDEFQPGDWVACGGGGYASHADIILVPKNLCVKVPPGVGLDEAAYTTLGSIALQGVRQACPTLGETVAVIGLGLVGQLTVQILKAAGCSVIGIDIDADAVNLAKEQGADVGIVRSQDVQGLVDTHTKGLGADAVIITAATSSNDPVELAPQIARDRGRVVMVGATGMDLPRNPYYMKELEFKLSRSYGPGRYDGKYEEGGIDYPIGYVRWTEKRNMEEFVNLIRQKKVDVKRLTTHCFPIDEAPKAYGLISGRRKERYVGILLEYEELKSGEPEGKVTTSVQIDMNPRVQQRSLAGLGVGFIGVGSFAQGYLLPAVKGSQEARLVGVCDATGTTAKYVGKKFGFDFCTSNSNEILDSESIGTVFIATRHNLHAQFVRDALKRGKNVFVEKPLAMSRDELRDVAIAYGDQQRASKNPLLMVGFNRRFAPLMKELKKFFSDVKEPLIVNYRINAGSIPKDHWTQDPVEGGGRIIGEVCHFVDIIQHVSDSEPERVFAEATRSDNRNVTNADNIITTLKMKNGSVGIITYLADGDKSVSKERIEVSGGKRTAILDNFQRLSLYLGGKERSIKGQGMDKGHKAEVESFIRLAKERMTNPSVPALIGFDSLVTTTKVTLAIIESLTTGDIQSM
jgi:polar amino acid transport system substrate-binding protein